MLKATLLVKNLKEGLSFSFHGVSSRSQLPVLLNFLIVAKGSSLTISSTDLEIGLVANIPAKVENAGEVSVPAKTFFDLVSSIEQEKIDLGELEGTLKLSGQGISATLPTLPASEFPKLFEEKGDKIGDIEKGEFDDEVSKIVFASSQDTGRPALSGVLIKKEAKDLIIVATDGFRLSLKKGPSLGLKSTLEKPLLVPSRVVREVVSVKNEGEGMRVLIYASDKNNQIVFECGNYLIVGRLIEAEYPNYEKIIPDDFSTKVTFDRLSAQNAVRSCSVFAREAANIIKMSVLKDKVRFSASASSVGEDEVDVEAKTEGEENEIAFNARYLLEFFSNMSGETVDFEMTGPLNAGVFKIPEDKNFLHLIMPIRIQE